MVLAKIAIREDVGTEKQIEGLANRTDLWGYFEKVPPSKADIILLQFIANDTGSRKAA
jgi:hypothetical protein